MIIRIPARFYGKVSPSARPKEIRRSKLYVWIASGDPQLGQFLHFARLVSALSADRAMKASAKTTVAAIESVLVTRRAIAKARKRQ